MSYSHARQVEVVASIDTTEAASHSPLDPHGNSPRAEIAVTIGGVGQEGDGADAAAATVAALEEPAEDVSDAVLSRIAAETDMVSCKTNALLLFWRRRLWKLFFNIYESARHSRFFSMLRWGVVLTTAV